MTMSIYLFFDPTLSPHLIESFGFSEVTVAWYFLAYMGSQSVCSLALSTCKESVDKRYIMIPSNFVVVIGLLLTGPSKILNIPNTPAINLAGLIISGLAIGVVYSLTV